MKSCWAIAAIGVVSVAVFGATSAVAAPLQVSAPQHRWDGPRMTDLRAQVAKELGSLQGIAVHADAQTGTLRILKGENLPMVQPTEAGVKTWLSAHKGMLGLQDPSSELALERVEPATGEFPWHYFQFKQQAHGLEIVERGLTVLVDAEGRLFQITGDLILTPALDLVPRVDGLTARDNAERFANYAGEAPFAPVEGRLVVHSLGDKARLAYSVVVSFARGPSEAPYHRRIYVDAHEGMVLGSRELIWTQQAATCQGDDWTGASLNVPCAQYQGGDLVLVDVVTLNNTLQTTDAQFSDNIGGVAILADGTTFDHVNAVSGAKGIETAYSYMQDFLNRPSWNHGGNGQDLGQFTTVNYGQQYPNAFATVVQLQNGEDASLSVFGNGDGVNLGETTQCLDVAGHELTHNVVAATAGLVYENQPGALNEHFADAFGTAIDKHYENNDDIMGENCTPGGNGIRRMDNPNAFNQPDHMDDYQNLPNTENGDYGGVHINSGIPNKAFFEVYDALGIEVAERIWYRALNQGGLGDRAQFLDFANAIATACTALGEPANTCTTVGTALSSVGLFVEVGGGGECPANSSPGQNGCVCDAGYRPTAAGDACEVIDDASCPANSSQVGEYCYCDEGYAVNEAGDACVLEGEAPCPSNAHRESGICVCDDGYAGNPETEQGTCAPQAGDCDSFSVYDEGSTSCVCIAGFVENGAGDCVPGAGGCGNETFVGRCEADSQFVVFCEADQISVFDCFGSPGLSCGWNGDQSYYDCIEAPVGCGDVPTTGQCNGNILERCEGTEVVDTNCAASGDLCIAHEMGGAGCVDSAWTCPSAWYEDTDCDCGCGGNDPACEAVALTNEQCNYIWCAGDQPGGDVDPANHANCDVGGDGDGDIGDGDGDVGDGDGDTGDGDGDTGDGDAGDGDASGADGGVGDGDFDTPERIDPGLTGGAQNGCSSVVVDTDSAPVGMLGLLFLGGLVGRRRRLR